MPRIEKLEKAVRQLYEAKTTGRDGWADWFYENHIFAVADLAEELADRYGANTEFCRAAGMLHDVADTEMQRSSEQHEVRSLEIAKKLLETSGFEQEDIKIIVDDAIRHHSCYGDELPQTLEGKVMATADAVVHLKSDFYLYSFWGSANEGRSYEKTKSWAEAKIKRDFDNKIFFAEVREENKIFYDALNNMLSMHNKLKRQDKNMDLKQAKLFTDGGSRGNPGPSAIAFVICKMDSSVVEKSGEYIGETTNNQAEYQALKMGLKRAQELGIKDLIVNMDSELVVKQINGLYKMKNADLRPHYEAVKQLERQFEKITFNHVPRALNAEADKEVNRILDVQK